MKSFFSSRLLFSILIVSLAFNGYMFLQACETPTNGNPDPDQCFDPCSKKFVGVPLSDAVAMVGEYGRNQAAFINRGFNEMQQRDPKGVKAQQAGEEEFEDARRVHFSMDTLRQFMCTVEQYIKEKGLKNEDGSLVNKCDLGIQLYYAAYPASGSVGNMPKGYEKRHTLIWVPTYRNAKGEIIELLPKGSASASKEGIALAQSGTEQNMMRLETDESMIMNHGELCPPPKGCGTNNLLGSSE